MLAKLTVLLLSLFSLNAGAASYSSLSQSDCSGSLSISLLDIASFTCTGNLSLSGGSITSDNKVTIVAGGLLTIEQFSITAPFVELISIRGITVGNGAVLEVSNGAFLGVGAGRDIQPINWSELRIPTPIELRPGAVISLSAPVPERSSLTHPISSAAGTLTLNDSSDRNIQLGNRGELRMATPVELLPRGDISLSAVPEPSSLMTLLLGLLVLAGFTKRTPRNQ